MYVDYFIVKHITDMLAIRYVNRLLGFHAITFKSMTKVLYNSENSKTSLFIRPFYQTWQNNG